MSALHPQLAALAAMVDARSGPVVSYAFADFSLTLYALAQMTGRKIMRRDFHQYGIGFVPCTIMGWVYLFAFVIATLATVFLIRSIWAVADLPGVEIVQALVLVAGVIATVRFARLRSN